MFLCYAENTPHFSHIYAENNGKIWVIMMMNMSIL